MLRFERLAWQPSAGDNWHSVDNIQLAADFLPYNARAFVTTGRKELQPFFQRDDIGGVVRTVELPHNDVPIAWRVILERPPQTLESELALFENEKFTHLISKNAGGSATQAKLIAARTLNIPVVMVQRPNKPECETFSDIQALIKRLGT